MINTQTDNNKIVFYNCDGQYLFSWINKPINKALELKNKWLKDNYKLLVMVYDYNKKSYYEVK